MNTKISSNGHYVIRKKDYPTKDIKSIKDELYVKPYTFTKNNNKESGFQVYMESPKKLYLPKFYGLNRYGKPIKNEITDGDDININFNGNLREEQKLVEEIYLKILKFITKLISQ